MKFSFSSFFKQQQEPVAIAPVQSVKINPKGLLPYQIASTQTIVNSLTTFNSAIDASSPGVGKTWMACVAARELNLKLFVICPKVVQYAWSEVAQATGATLIAAQTYEKTRNGSTKYLSVTRGATHSKAARAFQWNLPSDVLLVFDEAHYCKSPDSQNAKMLIQARKQNIKVLACSATLATSPLDMRAIGYLIGLHNLDNFWHWARNHGAKKGAFGGLTFNTNLESNKKILLNLHKQIFPNRGTRIKIADLGDQFPESLVTAECYDLGSDAQKFKDQMLDELAKLEQTSSNYQAQSFSILLKERQQAELLKVPVFVEMAEDAIAEGQSVAIFVNFKQTLHAIATRLKTTCIIQGDQTKEQRDTNVGLFQSDRSRVIVCNLSAGGVGVSLHDILGNYPRLSLISPSYSATHMKQVLGRVWRAGGKSKSIQKIIYANDTVERKACDAVRAKIINLDLLNDGDLTAGLTIPKSIIISI